MSSANLILNSNFAGLCGALLGTFCITSNASLIAPWVVDSCSALPLTLQANCNAGKGQLEQDNQIFLNPTSLTNIDLNPNAPSAVYQDVMIPGGFTGLSVTMQVGFNNNCGGSSGTFMLNVTNLVTNATLYSAVLTGQTGSFVTQSVNIPSTACGATRVELISQANSSCGPLITAVTLSATGTPPVNSACNSGYSSVNAPSNTIIGYTGQTAPTDPSLLLPQMTPIITGNGQNATVVFTFNNYGQTVNFTKFGDCLPLSSVWSTPTNAATVNLTSVFDTTQPCWVKAQNQFSGSIYIQATLNKVTYGENYGMTFTYSGAALQASVIGAVSAGAITYTASNIDYDAPTGKLSLTITPNTPANVQITSVSGLSGTGLSPITGPASQSALVYTGTFTCMKEQAQTFTYMGSINICIQNGSNMNNCIASVQLFTVTFAISSQCLFSANITNGIVFGSITDTVTNSNLLTVNDKWDLTLASSVLAAQGYYINVTGVTVKDGASGTPLTIDASCWNKLRTINTFGKEVFEFNANVMDNSVKSYAGYTPQICSTKSINLPFILPNKAVVYEFDFQLSFSPTAAKRDGGALMGVTQGSVTALAAVDTTKIVGSSAVSVAFSTMAVLVAAFFL
ncbi:hypothetical protein HDU98_007956 [Podochytrium sp. JEL0797]|nr:hypothetical protein HDU98_007956 [Podochytrium sp. JEL0797]